MTILTQRNRGTTSPVGIKSLEITPEPESLAQESWSIYSVIFNTIWEVKDPIWSILWGSMILIITGLSYHLRNLQTTFATEVQKLMNQGTKAATDILEEVIGGNTESILNDVLDTKKDSIKNNAVQDVLGGLFGKKKKKKD